MSIPEAVNDFYTVIENSINNPLSPRDNDVIFPSNPAQYRIQSLPVSGTLLVSVSDGSPLVAPVLNTPYDGPMQYTPDTDVVTTDTFQYDLLNNIAETSGIAVVTITISQARPTGPVDWATQLLNNGPLSGPNRIDPSVDRQEAGWGWGEKPDFETLNGWKYNVSRLLKWSADSVDRIDVQIANIVGTPDATETVKGKARIATQVETDAGSDDTLIVTPAKLTAWFSSLASEFVVSQGTNTNGRFRVWNSGLIEAWIDKSDSLYSPGSNELETMPIEISTIESVQITPVRDNPVGGGNLNFYWDKSTTTTTEIGFFNDDSSTGSPDAGATFYITGV